MKGKTVVTRTRCDTSASSSHSPTYGLVGKTIKEYRSQLGDGANEAFGLVQLASASLATAAWLVDGEADPEVVFEHCKENARRILKDRADRLRTKVLTDGAQSPAAH
jgi:hypothetical protein